MTKIAIAIIIVIIIGILILKYQLTKYTEKFMYTMTEIIKIIYTDCIPGLKTFGPYSELSNKAITKIVHHTKKLSFNQKIFAISNIELLVKSISRLYSKTNGSSVSKKEEK